MSLNFDQVAGQILNVGPLLQRRLEEAAQRAATAYGVFSQDDVEGVDQKARAAGAKLVWNIPGVIDRIAGRCRTSNPPSDYVTLAADGSLIDVDRHSPLRCYVLNTGWAVLRYGEQPSFEPGERASVKLDERDLAFVDPDTNVTIRRVDGQLLGIEQGIEELECLAELVDAAPPDLPLLALVDGPLVVWGLTDPRVKGLIQKKSADGASMLDRYQNALHRMQTACERRPAALVGYISYPGAEFVANLVRVAACPFPVPDCRLTCSSDDPATGRQCDGVATNDRTLFGRHLKPGEYGSLFQTTHQEGVPAVWFCYANVGDEIARLEFPDWVGADPARLELAVSLVLDQVRRGQGYPTALMEAHERAVISTGDRMAFQRLVLAQLEFGHLPVAGSMKSQSKRVRGV